MISCNVIFILSTLVSHCIHLNKTFIVFNYYVDLKGGRDIDFLLRHYIDKHSQYRKITNDSESV